MRWGTSTIGELAAADAAAAAFAAVTQTPQLENASLLPKQENSASPFEQEGSGLDRQTSLGDQAHTVSRAAAKTAGRCVQDSSCSCFVLPLCCIALSAHSYHAHIDLNVYTEAMQLRTCMLHATSTICVSCFHTTAYVVQDTLQSCILPSQQSVCLRALPGQQTIIHVCRLIRWGSSTVADLARLDQESNRHPTLQTGHAFSHYQQIDTDLLSDSTGSSQHAAVAAAPVDDYTERGQSPEPAQVFRRRSSFRRCFEAGVGQRSYDDRLAADSPDDLPSRCLHGDPVISSSNSLSHRPMSFGTRSGKLRPDAASGIPHGSEAANGQGDMLGSDKSQYRLLAQHHIHRGSKRLTGLKKAQENGEVKHSRLKHSRPTYSAASLHSALQRSVTQVQACTLQLEEQQREQQSMQRILQGMNAQTVTMLDKAISAALQQQCMAGEGLPS